MLSKSDTSRVALNAWYAGGVFHNENMFINPEVYNPERFVKNPENARVTDLIFGTGRVRFWTVYFYLDAVTHNTTVLQRACPGMHLAKNAIVRDPRIDKLTPRLIYQLHRLSTR